MNDHDDVRAIQVDTLRQAAADLDRLPVFLLDAATWLRARANSIEDGGAA